MNLINGWDTGRPVYNRLPIDSQQYQREPINENDIIVSDVLTDWVDTFLMLQKTNTDNLFVDYLDGTTAKSETLDWLGQLCGFTDEFWSKTWDDNIKRQLIINSYRFIWPNRGNAEVLNFLIKLFNLPTYPTQDIYLVPYLLSGITPIAAIAGRKPNEFFIRLKTVSIRNDYFWKTALMFVRLYAPATTNGVVGYDYFYAGLSATNEGVFDYIYENTFASSIEWGKNNPGASCLDLVSYLSNLLNAQIRISKTVVLAAGLSVPRIVGNNLFFIFISDSITINNSWEYYLITKLLTLYCSKKFKFNICHKYFRAGVSGALQPIFAVSGTIKTEAGGDIFENASLLTESQEY